MKRISSAHFLEIQENLAIIAQEAAQEILNIYTQSDFGIQIKTDDSPLTRADLASNAVLVKRLSEITPSVPIVSEEMPLLVNQTYDYFWLIDPLDGTKEFIAKNDQFCINIALVHKKRPVLGLIFVPVTQACYWGIAGKGAYKATKETDFKPVKLQVARFKKTDVGLKIPVSNAHLNAQTRQYIETNFEKPQLVPQGSALKFLAIAEGSAHVYPRLGPCSEWDTAAAQIIVEEAGGQLLELATHKPLTYNKDSILSPHFLCLGLMEEG
jgi:3'(2'), 5'-bisphosphate nucleotidase